MNRLKDYFGAEPEDRSPRSEYFAIWGGVGCYYVSREVAEQVAGELGRRRPPRWLRFRELSGSEVRVRSAKIDTICEPTPDQRKRERSFLRARRAEEKREHRSWEEDEQRAGRSVYLACLQYPILDFR